MSEYDLIPPEESSAKILIAGGFGVGKTTLVGAVSEIQPLRTEEQLTAAGIGVDDLDNIERKTTTTVAMDFGRITLPEAGIVLYLFGTPGQARFWFMWDDMLQGALGAIVLADTRRLDRSFAAIDFFEDRKLPFIIGVNCFDGEQHHSAEEIRAALHLTEPDTPIVMLDARSRDEARSALVALIDLLISKAKLKDASPV